MVYFLPSDIARLVLGYLKDQHYQKTYKCFLKECPHLQECYAMLKTGSDISQTFMVHNLLVILDEWAQLKRNEYSPVNTSNRSSERRQDSVHQGEQASSKQRFDRKQNDHLQRSTSYHSGSRESGRCVSGATIQDTPVSWGRAVDHGADSVRKHGWQAPLNSESSDDLSDSHTIDSDKQDILVSSRSNVSDNTSKSCRKMSSSKSPVLSRRTAKKSSHVSFVDRSPSDVEVIDSVSETQPSNTHPKLASLLYSPNKIPTGSRVATPKQAPNVKPINAISPENKQKSSNAKSSHRCVTNTDAIECPVTFSTRSCYGQSKTTSGMSSNIVTVCDSNSGSKQSAVSTVVPLQKDSDGNVNTNGSMSQTGNASSVTPQKSNNYSDTASVAQTSSLRSTPNRVGSDQRVTSRETDVPALSTPMACVDSTKKCLIWISAITPFPQNYELSTANIKKIKGSDKMNTVTEETKNKIKARIRSSDPVSKELNGVNNRKIDGNASEEQRMDVSDTVDMELNGSSKRLEGVVSEAFDSAEGGVKNKSDHNTSKDSSDRKNDTIDTTPSSSSLEKTIETSEVHGCLEIASTDSGEITKEVVNRSSDFTECDKNTVTNTCKDKDSGNPTKKLDNDNQLTKKGVCVDKDNGKLPGSPGKHRESTESYIEGTAAKRTSQHVAEESKRLSETSKIGDEDSEPRQTCDINKDDIGSNKSDKTKANDTNENEISKTRKDFDVESAGRDERKGIENEKVTHGSIDEGNEKLKRNNTDLDYSLKENEPIEQENRRSSREAESSTAPEVSAGNATSVHAGQSELSGEGELVDHGDQDQESRSSGTLFSSCTGHVSDEQEALQRTNEISPSNSKPCIAEQKSEAGSKSLSAPVSRPEIVHVTPLKTAEALSISSHVTPVKLFLTDEQSNTTRSPRRKKPKTPKKRLSDVHVSPTAGTTSAPDDALPIFQQILTDTRLHEKLAETCNLVTGQLKHSGSNSHDGAKSKDGESSADGDHTLTQDEIETMTASKSLEEILDMDTNFATELGENINMADPAFESLFKLFGTDKESFSENMKREKKKTDEMTAEVEELEKSIHEMACANFLGHVDDGSFVGSPDVLDEGYNTPDVGTYSESSAAVQNLFSSQSTSGQVPSPLVGSHTPCHTPQQASSGDQYVNSPASVATQPFSPYAPTTPQLFSPPPSDIPGLSDCSYINPHLITPRRSRLTSEDDRSPLSEVRQRLLTSTPTQSSPLSVHPYTASSIGDVENFAAPNNCSPLVRAELPSSSSTVDVQKPATYTPQAKKRIFNQFGTNDALSSPQTDPCSVGALSTDPYLGDVDRDLTLTPYGGGEYLENPCSTIENTVGCISLPPPAELNAGNQAITDSKSQQTVKGSKSRKKRKGKDSKSSDQPEQCSTLKSILAQPIRNPLPPIPIGDMMPKTPEAQITGTELSSQNIVLLSPGGTTSFSIPLLACEDDANGKLMPLSKEEAETISLWGQDLTVSAEYSISTENQATHSLVNAIVSGNSDDIIQQIQSTNDAPSLSSETKSKKTKTGKGSKSKRKSADKDICDEQVYNEQENSNGELIVGPGDVLTATPIQLARTVEAKPLDFGPDVVETPNYRKIAPKHNPSSTIIIVNNSSSKVLPDATNTNLTEAIQDLPYIHIVKKEDTHNSVASLESGTRKVHDNSLAKKNANPINNSPKLSKVGTNDDLKLVDSIDLTSDDASVVRSTKLRKCPISDLRAAMRNSTLKSKSVARRSKPTDEKSKTVLATEKVKSKETKLDSVETNVYENDESAIECFTSPDVTPKKRRRGAGTLKVKILGNKLGRNKSLTNSDDQLKAKTLKKPNNYEKVQPASLGDSLSEDELPLSVLKKKMLEVSKKSDTENGDGKKLESISVPKKTRNMPLSTKILDVNKPDTDNGNCEILESFSSPKKIGIMPLSKDITEAGAGDSHCVPIASVCSPLTPSPSKETLLGKVGLTPTKALMDHSLLSPSRPDPLDVLAEWQCSPASSRKRRHASGAGTRFRSPGTPRRKNSAKKLFSTTPTKTRSPSVKKNMTKYFDSDIPVDSVASNVQKQKSIITNVEENEMNDKLKEAPTNKGNVFSLDIFGAKELLPEELETLPGVESPESAESKTLTEEEGRGEVDAAKSGINVVDADSNVTDGDMNNVKDMVASGSVLSEPVSSGKKHKHKKGKHKKKSKHKDKKHKHHKHHRKHKHNSSGNQLDSANNSSETTLQHVHNISECLPGQFEQKKVLETNSDILPHTIDGSTDGNSVNVVDHNKSAEDIEYNLQQNDSAGAIDPSAVSLQPQPEIGNDPPLIKTFQDSTVTDIADAVGVTVNDSLEEDRSSIENLHSSSAKQRIKTLNEQKPEQDTNSIGEPNANTSGGPKVLGSTDKILTNSSTDTGKNLPGVNIESSKDERKSHRHRSHEKKKSKKRHRESADGESIERKRHKKSRHKKAKKSLDLSGLNIDAALSQLYSAPKSTSSVTPTVSPVMMLQSPATAANISLSPQQNNAATPTMLGQTQDSDGGAEHAITSD